MISTTQRGFTLIELLVVIAIIGILAAVVLASLNDAREQAREKRALAELRNVHTAMEMMYNETGLYPHGQNAYCPPISASGNEVKLETTGLAAYIGSLQDPWGNSYAFDQDYQCDPDVIGCNGVNFTGANFTSALVSCGPVADSDGNSGTNAAGCGDYDGDNVVYVFCQL